MKVRWITLENFRNHAHSELACAEQANIFLGENGAGKTNVVEAVGYLCLTRSFYASSERTVIQVGQERFRVGGEMVSDRGTSFRISIRFDALSSEKSFQVNGTAASSLAGIIGKFPVVVASPEHHNVTFGAPADRRKFLDLVIAQASPVYVEDLMEYRSALRQRNKLLLAAKLSGKGVSETMESWDEALITRGARVMQRRREFLVEFKPVLSEAYARIGGKGEDPSVEYESAVGLADAGSVEEIRQAFRKALEETKEGELRMGTTLAGPHRDELLLELDGLELRKFASQGQHKTFLVALKLAEFEYLRHQCHETPILILDDVFSQLDRGRSERLFESVQNLGQIFMTTTDEGVFPAGVLRAPGNKAFRVTEGAVIDAEA